MNSHNPTENILKSPLTEPFSSPICVSPLLLLLQLPLHVPSRLSTLSSKNTQPTGVGDWSSRKISLSGSHNDSNSRYPWCSLLPSYIRLCCYSEINLPNIQPTKMAFQDGLNHLSENNYLLCQGSITPSQALYYCFL